LANLFLRPLARRVDRRTGLAAEAEVTYEFRAVCRAADEAHIRVLLVQAFSGGAFTLRELRSQDIDVGDGAARVEVRAFLAGQGADPTRFELAVSRLSLEPGVSAVSWQLKSADTGVIATGEADEGVVESSNDGWQRLTRSRL
jgi:putative Mg2+ transporter-C (MgtC) family protein